MTAIDRTAHPRPGARLSRKELDFRYDLTEVDLTFVRANARGDIGRLLLAVLLKTRQDLGCFPVPSEVHAGIIAHVAARLGLAAPLLPSANVHWPSKLYRPCRNLRAKSADLKSVWIQHTTLCAVLQSIDNTE